MDSLDLDVLRTAQQWLNAGPGVSLVTVVNTWGSAPRPIGSMMAIRADGQVVGSVSGGCIEDDLIAQVQQGLLSKNLPHTMSYGVSADEARRFGLPCGGTVQVVVEPLGERAKLAALLGGLAEQRLLRRELNMLTGEVSYSDSNRTHITGLFGDIFKTTHGPKYRLLIIGGGQLSKYLADMAVALDYHVTVCDPREEYAEQWAELPSVRQIKDMPDDAVTDFHPDSNSAIVTLTHDPKLDDLALMIALKSNAFYVGALGSRVNHATRKARMLAEPLYELSEAEIDRLYAPIGLDIEAKTPPEIALAILAEMTALKRGARQIPHKKTAEARHITCETA
jgi:xanthine dehydrogenase accessory factor